MNAARLAATKASVSSFPTTSELSGDWLWLMESDTTVLALKHEW